MRVTKVRRTLAVIAIIIAASSGARLLMQRPKLAPAPAPAAASVATPERWRLGSLVLAGCEIGSRVAGPTISAFCADFPVPENWGDPNSRQIKLHLALIKSESAKPASDLLVYLAGGPGAAATADYSGVGRAFDEMRVRRHVLLIDQRGTGASNALSCKVSDAKGEAFVGASAADEAEHIDLPKLHQELKDCLARLASRADPRFYTTGDAVLDLEAVRQALGAPPLDLIGVSYGTRMAQQYAATYPAVVRSLVLDSVVPNTLVLGSEHAANMEAALQARFAVCVKTPECFKRFGDPYAALSKLRQQLRGKPVIVNGRDPLTNASVQQKFAGADLAVGVRLFAYNPVTAALLPLAIDEALKGDFQPLLGQEQLITKGLGEQLTDGMGLSVSCAEDADLLKLQPQDADTLLGTSLVEYTLGSCEVWPRGTRRKDFHQPLTGAIPTLLLAGEFDPVTPARYGTAVAASLSNARVLTLKGQGHGVMSTGCVPKLLREFIEQLQPAKLEAKCIDALGDTPAFLGYSGAAP